MGASYSSWAKVSNITLLAAMEYLRRDEDFLTVLHKLRLRLSLLQSSTVGHDEVSRFA